MFRPKRLPAYELRTRAIDAAAGWLEGNLSAGYGFGEDNLDPKDEAAMSRIVRDIAATLRQRARRRRQNQPNSAERAARRGLEKARRQVEAAAAVDTWADTSVRRTTEAYANESSQES